MSLDLSAIPIVDNHCHGLYTMHTPATLDQWRPNFTESYDPAMRTDHVATTLFYQRLTRELAGFLGCEPNDQAVIAARSARDPQELAAALLRAARIETLCIDRGFPTAGNVAPDESFVGDSGVRIAPMLRLEVLLQELIPRCPTLDDLQAMFAEALRDVRAEGYVALKSIVAYRTGLNIETWPVEAVDAAFARARREVEKHGKIRITHKPLLDTMLHQAFAIASAQELPVQFHTGYGDSDCDMLLANPFQLRAVLQRPEYRGMPVVLLHESYPYTRQGAFLAAIYANVYLDLSYGIPVLGFEEMLAFTRQALGVAPYSKLMYSSDGVGLPEVHWASALHGRQVLGQVLGETVAHGDLSPAMAQTAGAAILRENARRVYGLA
ncbi:MAG TPA: amidohydrolase family protein [Chloroflexota bacterium]|nr:amidohydrolase family protein [Chloroflexota bacterium]